MGEHFITSCQVCLLPRSAPGGSVEVYPRGEKNGVRREKQMTSSAQGQGYMNRLQSITRFFPILLSSVLPSAPGYHLFGLDLVYPDDLVSPKVLPSYQCSGYSPLEFGNLPTSAVSLSPVNLESSGAEYSFCTTPTPALKSRWLPPSFVSLLRNKVILLAHTTCWPQPLPFLDR